MTRRAATVPEIEVPAAPAMGRVPNVELMHTGSWNLGSGPATFTVDDLAAAVGALDCPAVRRPILKLGHTPDPAPGQPAIGFIANMATAEQGRTLIGDYVGMPGWLVDEDADGVSVLTATYPDRSVEGQWNFRCQIGHTHPFVITGVALLGDEQPGIGTIQSLQDLAAVYDVAAAAGEEGSGEPITITVRNGQTQGGVMPNPRPTQVAASVTTEDVRRAFYASPLGDGWSMWIEEMQLEPLQLIVMDDDKAVRSRIPIVVGDGDGADAVSFGDPVSVVVRYDDVAASAAASAPRPGRTVRYASRAESRPPLTPAQRMAEVAAATARQKTSPSAVAAGASSTTEGAGMSTDPAKLREGLGLAPDSSDEELNAALLAASGAGTSTTAPTTAPASTTSTTPEAPAAEPVAAAATPRAAGTMVIDASAWDEREARIKRLETEAAKRARDERDQVIASAVQEGKFAPNRKEHWVRLWDADPEGTRQVIAGLQKNVIPVESLGFTDDTDATIDNEFAHLFPPVPGNRKGA
jgi:hypothetical protein